VCGDNTHDVGKVLDNSPLHEWLDTGTVIVTWSESSSREVNLTGDQRYSAIVPKHQQREARIVVAVEGARCVLVEFQMLRPQEAMESKAIPRKLTPTVIIDVGITGTH
jgi:hypothetical protein